MIYARVKKGKITEFPVYSNEALSPLDGYLSVVEPEAAPLRKNEKSILKCTLVNGKPVAEYVIFNKTIKDILTENKFSYTENKDRKFSLYSVLEQKSILARIDSATNDILDIFAAERHYDSLQSCLSYANSSIMDYRKDAQHASDVRDITWSSVIEFKNKLKKDEVPVPVSMTELKSCFENVQWD